MERLFTKYKKDYYGGGLMLLLGMSVVFQSVSYDIGTLTQMGPGYFPAILGGMLAATGMAIALSAKNATAEDPAKYTPAEWRGWFCIVLSIVAFVVAGTYGGLIPASFLVVFISALGDRENTFKSALLLSLAIVAVSAIIFWWALDLQLPLFRWA